MKIKYGNGNTEYGSGVKIELSGEDVALAIEALIVSRNIHISGPRTISVNGSLCHFGGVYVDPSGYVIAKGKKISGRGKS
jgi:hypothetical protein